MQNYPMLSSKSLFNKGQSIYIHQSTFLPNFIEEFHVHDFIEITYVISGECTHIENDRSFNAKTGDLFIVNYGIPHANIKSKSCQDPFIAYDVTFTPDFIDIALSGEQDFLNIKSSFLFKSLFPENSPIGPNLKLSDHGFYEFEKLIKNMFDEYTEKPKGYYDLLRAYLIELIIKIFRRIDNAGNATPKSKQEYYINLAIQYMQNNYSEKVKLEDIAYRSFLSKSYFSQLFKDITGLCFSDYLQKIRIDHACTLLESSNLTISEIAYKTGFNDVKFFYSVFKKVTKLTPGDYRKN